MNDHAETTLRVVRGGIADFDEALRWALVVKADQFATATMLRFELEQYLVISDDTTEPLYQWNALVSGLVEEM